VKKLRDSAAQEPRMIVPDHSAPSKSSQPTAADILGLNRQRNTARQKENSLEMELDQYLSDPNQGTGILEYWQVDLIFLSPYKVNLFTDMHYNLQEHQHRYPRIFRLAMDIIPIQASSVPCERVFSSGKQTMAPRRSRISAQLMESLQILKFSIRKGGVLTFTEGMSWNDELIEFEHVARTAPLGDPEAYGRSLEDPEERESDYLEDGVDEPREMLEEEQMDQVEGREEEEEDDDDNIYV